MDCINIDSTKFTTVLLDEVIDTSLESHRQRIRHLYRRLGYGASLDDINAINPNPGDSTTFADLVDGLISAAASTTFPAEFDWTERGVAIQGYYCKDIKKYIGTVCDVTTGAVIQGDCSCSTTNVPVQLDEDDKPVNSNIEIKNIFPPSSINGILSNYWMNESIVGITNSIRAKLMLFWHSHFAADEKVHQDPHAVLRYFKVLFTYAFSDFKEFVKEIGRTPLMLVFLSGHDNHGNPSGPTNGNPYPNENYARELLELFTMGIEYNDEPNYDKSDINELARALSGLRVRRYIEGRVPNEDELRFQYNRHDWVEKTILEVTYNSADAGWENIFNGALSVPTESGPNGQPYYPTDITRKPYTQYSGSDYQDSNDDTVTDGDYIDDSGNLVIYDGVDEKTKRMIITAMVDEYNYIHDNIIFVEKENAIAYFICKKLYKFYVYGDTDKLDQGSLDSYIESLATTFKDSNWDIASVLKQLFKSEHFYDPGIMGTQIKSPVECAASFFRAANLQPNNGFDGNGGSGHYAYRLGLFPANYIPTADKIITNPQHPNYYGGTYNLITGEGIEPAFVRSLYGSQVYQGDIMKMNKTCAKMGQHLLNPPDVAGWPGHHLWLNEFTLVTRWEMVSRYFIDYLSTAPQNNITLEYDTYGNTYGNVMNALNEFRKMAAPSATNTDALHEVSLPTPLPTELNGIPTDGIQMVWKMWRHMFAVEPTPRQIIDAWAAYMENYTYPGFPSPNSDSPEVRRRIGNLLLHFIRQPEFQLI